jgi:anaerobic selenocysteine-containing dehydrogenase
MPQITRRELLGIGLSTGAATLAGCERAPGEWIESPLHDVQGPIGRPIFFASTCKLCAEECGVQARVVAGRLKKLEGNPAWPGTGGAMCALGQAGPQALYHPRRLTKGRLPGGTEVTPQAAVAALVRQLATMPNDTVVCIVPPHTGHLHSLIGSLGWRQAAFDPGRPRALDDANERCFGARDVHYLLERAESIVSFDADLVTSTATAAVLGDWKRRRQSESAPAGRFIHVGPRLSTTAAAADHWLPVRPGTEGMLALAVAGAVAWATGEAPLASMLQDWTPQRAAQACDLPRDRVERLIRHVIECRSAVAIPGAALAHYSNGPQIVRAIALVNRLLDAPISFGFEPPFEDVAPPRMASAGELVEMCRAASALIIVDQDLASFCPELLATVRCPVVYLATQDDRTAELADLVVPLATRFECWDDAFPRHRQQSLASIVQPVVAPYAGVGPGDVLLEILRAQQGWREKTYADFLKRRWHALCPADEDFDAFWRRVCGGGLWTLPYPRDVRAEPPSLESLPTAMTEPEFSGDGIFLYVYPEPLTGGRRAGLPWLDERFDSATGVAWESPVEVHPETARALGLRDGDVVEFEVGSNQVQAPVALYPGMRRDTVGLALGRAGSGAVRGALAGRFTELGDPLFSTYRVTLRKVRSGQLARIGAPNDRGGRALDLLDRRPVS